MRKVTGEVSTMEMLSPELKSQLVALRGDCCRAQAEYGEFISRIDRLMSGGNGKAHPQSKTPRNPVKRPIKQRRLHTKRSGILPAVVEFLGKNGPKSTPALLKMLAETGQPVQGQRPIQTLYSTLRNDSKNSVPRVKRKRDLWYAVATKN